MAKPAEAPPDIELLFADLAKTHPGQGLYSKTDKYRDFRDVFLSSEKGKRVLYEIMRWGHMFVSSAYLGGWDPNKTMFSEGERNMALRIFGAVHNVPVELPKTQTQKEPE